MRRINVKPSGLAALPQGSTAADLVPACRMPPRDRSVSARAASNRSLPTATGDRATGGGMTCFVGGTMIMTTRGEKPVETLRAGELLLTMHDKPWRQSLLCVGCSRIELTSQPDPNALAPVLIRAGALMKGSPIRDLRVSPGEGILLDGRLVPARLLVNGTTILQERAPDSITYYYLWLAAHALLIADGTLAESSYEDELRQDFDDAANVTAMAPGRPGGKATQEQRCIPLLTEGPELLVIQQRLALRERGSNAIQ
jgi:hypothetical protein